MPEALLHRIFSEFIEMPGLRLTSRQAQRLWGLDEATCTRLLDMLVDAKFLWNPSHGMYCRRSDGRFALPRPTPVKAGAADVRRFSRDRKAI